MATQIISVSIPVELGNFLEENPEISPSKIIQSKLIEMKNDETNLQNRIKAYEIKMYKLSGKLTKVLEYCESKGFAIPENVLE